MLCCAERSQLMGLQWLCRTGLTVLIILQLTATPGLIASSVPIEGEKCFAQMYACVSTLPNSPTSQYCSSQLLDESRCVTNASGLCSTQFSSVYPAIGSAVLDKGVSACRITYCYNPVVHCVGTTLLTAYTSSNYVSFCSEYETRCYSALYSLCDEREVFPYVAIYSAICAGTSGSGNGQPCMVEAISCIGYAFYDPGEQDLNLICKNSSAVLSCIDAILARTTCVSAVTLITPLKELYANSCASASVCQYTQLSCLSTAVSTSSNPNSFINVVCSNLVSIKSCLLASSCSSQFTNFTRQLETGCASQLCRAGIQSCYSTYSFNSDLLQENVTTYLTSWCGASANIETCLGYRTALCNQTGFVFGSLATSLNGLCAAATSGSTGACYWSALRCIYGTVVQYGTPASFFTANTDDFCNSASGINGISSCLLAAKGTCGGDSVNSNAITEIYNAITSTCQDICSDAKKVQCYDSLSYYLQLLFNGTSTICGYLTEQKTCLGHRIKTCSNRTSAITSQNYDLLNSIFVGISSVCTNASRPNGTTVCITSVVTCFVDFFDSLGINNDLLNNQTLCTAANVLKQCVETRQTNCSGTVLSTFNKTLIAIFDVVKSIPVCNPETLCRIDVAADCVAALSVLVTKASGYQPPVSYDGSTQTGFCRDVDKSTAVTCASCGGSDFSRQPQICESFDFFWGSLCIDINSTLQCVINATLQCTNSIQTQLQLSVTTAASTFERDCRVSVYTCDIVAATNTLSLIVDYGLQLLLSSDTPNAALCWWISKLSIDLWDYSVQCSPYFSQYTWQFVEAYVSIATVFCTPPELANPPIVPPLPSWNQSLTSDCSVVSINTALSVFFETLLTVSISVEPDTDEISSAWVLFQETYTSITTEDTSYSAGQCVWIQNIVTKIIAKINIIITFITSPPNCYLSDAYQCVYDLQYYVAQSGLAGAGQKDDSNLNFIFCSVADLKFTCIQEATVYCADGSVTPIYELYYAIQETVAISCVNYCEQEPCANGGQCIPNANGYTCICLAGYSGPTCEPTCDVNAAYTCVSSTTTSLFTADYVNFCLEITGVTTCLATVSANGNCDYAIIVDLLEDIFEGVTESFAVTIGNCSIAPPSNPCSFENITTNCLEPYLRDIEDVIDQNTQLLKPDVCSRWESISSCVSSRGCASVYQSLFSIFSASCQSFPASNCSLIELIDSVNLLAQSLATIPIAFPPQSNPQVEDPTEDTEDYGCPCGEESADDSSAANVVDESGYNFDIDVCGNIGFSLNQVLVIGESCGSQYSVLINNTVTSLLNTFLTREQCSQPCRNNRCSSGSTCVPNVGNNAYGYTCICLPGYTGRFCDSPPPQSCDIDRGLSCLTQFQSVLNSLFNASTSTAANGSYCSQLDVQMACLVSSLLPCSSFEYAVVNMASSLYAVAKKFKCSAAPPVPSCSLNATFECVISLLDQIYAYGSDDQCYFLSAAATCTQSVYFKCDNDVIDIDIETTIKRTWALYDTACSPPTCSVSTVETCLTELFNKIQYGLGSQDLCSLGADTTVCVTSSIVDCPPYLANFFLAKLATLLSVVYAQCNYNPCAINPCFNGGTCALDASNVQGFNCTCTPGWTGQSCLISGCDYDKTEICVRKVQAVFETVWTDCPVINCGLITDATTCLSNVQLTCPNNSYQIASLKEMLLRLKLGYCVSPLTCDDQPDSCPVVQLQQCYSAFLSLSVDSKISSTGAPEVESLYPLWVGAYACLTSLSTNCTASFQFNLTKLLTYTDVNLTNSGSCNTEFLKAAFYSVNTTIGQIKSQETIPVVVRETLCSNMLRLLTVSSELLALCSSVSLRNEFDVVVYEVQLVCTLPCLLNPCINGGTCVSLPNGGYTCSCYAGFTGSACEKAPPTCQLNEAIQCVNNLALTVSFIVEESSRAEICLAVSIAVECVTSKTVTCDSMIVYGLTQRVIAILDLIPFSCLPICQTNPCLNSGTCVQGTDTSDYNCTCAFGYTGSNCQEESCDNAGVSFCSADIVSYLVRGDVSGFCGNVSRALTCINSFTGCSDSVLYSEKLSINGLSSAFCTTGGSCDIASLITSCLTFLSNAGIPLWDEVNEQLNDFLCRRVTTTAQCIASTTGCSVVAQSVTDYFNYQCATPPVETNCSLTTITEKITTLELHLSQAKSKNQQPSPTSPEAPSNMCMPPTVRNLTVDSFGTGELWIDGQKQTLPNSKNWRKSDTVLLPNGANFIAIRSTSTPCREGSNLVTSTGDFIVSDDRWKCSPCSLADDSFAAPTFDDNAWPSAEIIASYQAKNLQVEGVDSKTRANWIWTPNWNGKKGQLDSPVCCRIFFGVRTLSVQATGAYSLYIDGVEQTNLPTDGDTTATRKLSQSASFIAINATVEFGSPLQGVLASVTGDLVVTGRRWTCTNEFSENWFQPFGASYTWSPAVIGSANTDSSTNGISSAASWILTDSQTSDTVFCAVHFTQPTSYPVDDSGSTCNDVPPVPDDGSNPCWYIQSDITEVRKALSQCSVAVSAGYSNLTSVLLSDYEVNATCVNPCLVNPCLYGGTCNANGLSFNCTCQPWFTGAICQTGGSCDRTESLTCLIQVIVSINQISLNYSYITQSSTEVTLRSIYQCLSVNLLTCGSQDEYVYTIISYYITYIFELMDNPDPTVSCEYSIFMQCTSSLITSIYVSNNELEASLTAMLQCVYQISDTCGQSGFYLEVLEITWQIIEDLFPNPLCSLSTSLDCTATLSQTFITSPTNKNLLCPLLLESLDCVSSAVVQCDNRVLALIQSSVSVRLSGPYELCFDACYGVTCYNNGVCDQSGSEAVCVCAEGFTGPLCLSETNCNLYAVNECLLKAQQKVVFALLDSCRYPLDCSATGEVAELLACISNNTVSCPSAVTSLIVQINSAFRGIYNISGICGPPGSDCFVPPPTCDFTTIRLSLLTLVQTVLVEFSSTPGPDFGLICQQRNVTLTVIATLRVSCPDLDSTLTDVLTWVNSLIGTVCEPTCPPSGSLSSASDCLEQLKAVVDSAINITVMALEAQIVFCGAVEQSASCVQSSLSLCPDASIASQLSVYIAKVVVLCTLPCITYNPCASDAICVPVSYNEYTCECNPLSTSTFCFSNDTVPGCDINEASTCLQSVATYISARSSDLQSLSSQRDSFCSVVNTTLQCVVNSTSTCSQTNGLVQTSYTILETYQNFVNVTCYTACDSNPCDNNGICNVDVNDQFNFNCTCSPGYLGPTCSEVECSETDINSCFFAAIDALFSFDVATLCSVHVELSNCISARVRRCPSSVQEIYLQVQSTFSEFINISCQTSPPSYGSCNLTEVNTLCFIPQLGDLLSFLASPTTAQLSTVCRRVTALTSCVTRYNGACQPLVSVIDVIFSVICDVPPNPQCSLNSALEYWDQFQAAAWQAAYNWANNLFYGGKSFEDWIQLQNQLSAISKYDLASFDTSVDSSLFACWYVEYYNNLMTQSLISCADDSFLASITVSINQTINAYLSTGACSRPCQPNLCAYGGQCTPTGKYGFNCTCPAGLTGNFCGNGAGCDIRRAYSALRLFKLLVGSAQTIDFTAFYNNDGCRSLADLEESVVNYLLPCIPDSADTFYSLLLFLKSLCLSPPTGISCEINSAASCAFATLTSLVPDNPADVSTPSNDKLCVLFSEQLNCSLAIIANCPAPINATIEALVYWSFSSTQLVCTATPSCSLTTARGCLENLFVALETSSGDTCSDVINDVTCIDQSTLVCPSFVKTDINITLYQSNYQSAGCIPPCERLPCFNDGTCVPGSGTDFTCRCTSNFTGEYCDTPFGCVLSSVETCAQSSIATIVTALLDPCMVPIQCSTLNVLNTCLQNNTFLCDSSTKSRFDVIVSSLQSQSFICNSSRAGPPSCDNPGCDIDALTSYTTQFLLSFFAEVTSVSGPNYVQICSDLNATATLLLSTSRSCTDSSYRSTVNSVIAFLNNITESKCSGGPLCFPTQALDCYEFINATLENLKQRPDLPADQKSELCASIEIAVSCVRDNIDQCNSTDSVSVSINSMWNFTLDVVQQICPLPCFNNPCKNGGTCVPYATSYTCSCVQGFSGRDCEFSSLYPYSNITRLNCDGNYGITLSQMVQLDFSIKVFCDQFDTLYIKPQGFVSFGSDTPARAFTSFCTQSTSLATLVAPLFARQDCSCSGSAVYFSTFSTFGTVNSFQQSIIDRATSQVRQFGGADAAAFMASQVIVVTWYNVLPYPCQYYQLYYNITEGSTYQLIIASNLLKSYAIFIYEEVNVAPLIPQVFNGVKAPGTCVSNWNPKTVNDANILNVVPASTGFPGLWFYKLFQPTPCSPSPENQCLNYVMSTVDLSVDIKLPPCPCNGQLAAADPRFSFQYVDWFRYCFGYNIPMEVSGGIAVNQVCCYNSRQNGSLYTYAPFAGLPTVSGSLVSDIQIYQACCVNSTLYCNVFLAKRPISLCDAYTGPAQALMWGDPHFYSVDGLAFTFNGIGEYVMTRTRNRSYELQARTAQYVDSSGVAYNASGFVAFAARKQGSSTVQVSLNSANNGLVLVLDGQQRTAVNFTSNSSLYLVQTSTAINVTFPDGWTLNFALAGRYLSVVQTLPVSAWNNTLGLLGLYDGQMSNDLMAPDGTVLTQPSNMATIHYGFGQKWKISDSESLFTYGPGQSTSTFSQPNFVPVFDSPCQGRSDATEKQLCGNSANCYYDYCVTGDSALAAATLASETEYNAKRRILETTAPLLSITELQDSLQQTGYYFINAIVNQSLTFTIKAASTRTVTFKIVGNVSNDATAVLNEVTGVFTWTPTNTVPVDVSFRAIDSNGGVSAILQVYVKLCNRCSSQGVCNFNLARPFGDGTLHQVVGCTCNVGYTGNQCAEPYNACLLSPCGLSNTAGCIPKSPAVQQTTGLSHSCLNCSEPGFGVDPTSQLCTDIDECSTGTSQCSQDCINTQGSYYCTCRAGYLLSGSYDCIFNTRNVILTIRLRFDWSIQYTNPSSTLFIQLKTVLETLFRQIISKSESVVVQRFFQSSVGAEIAVNYNALISPSTIAEANIEINAYLNRNKWRFFGADGTVYPVIASPVLQIGGLTVSTPIDPCQSFVCDNGGTCQSAMISSEVYLAPTCICSASYTGTWCEVSIPTSTGSATSSVPTTTTSPELDSMKIAIGVAVPLTAIIIALIAVGVFCRRRPSGKQFGYRSNMFGDSNSSILNESLGLDGNRSLRMNRFWPVNARGLNNPASYAS